jgi:hypothetical protein
MAKIKIRYVAQVEINAECDESKCPFSLEEIKKETLKNLTPELKQLIEDLYIDYGICNVEQIVAEAWMED